MYLIYLLSHELVPKYNKFSYKLINYTQQGEAIVYS